MRSPEEQAEVAAVQAAVARGLIGGEQLREVLLLQEELSRQGHPCPILHLLRARWLPPDSLPWLREVHRRALREAQGKPAGRRADSDRLDSPWDSVPPTIPPGLMNLGAELARRDPAQDPAGVQEFLAMSLGRRSDRLGSGRSSQVTWHDPLAGKSAPSNSEALTLPRGSDRFTRPAQRVSRYEVVRELARGGMGVVYVARDPELDREVALKVLKPFEEEQGDEVERFKREARAMARLSHPNVVSVFDAGCEGRNPYLVMELVQGESLKDRIKRLGVIEPREAARIGAGMARALHHAHQAGILHRDVKPANVLVREDGEPLLIDFGLVRSVGPAASLTRPGEVLGTPLYMAPEQARGDLELVDVRTDIYSLGATLYHAVTGRTPFQGPDPLAVMASIAVEEPGSIVAQLPEFDPALERIILRCLRKERSDRPQSGLELAEELEAWSAGLQVAHGRRSGKVSQAHLAGGLLTLIVGAVGAGLVLARDPGPGASRIAPARPPEPPPVLPPAQPPPPKEEHPGELCREGREAQLGGDLISAADLFKRAVELDPDDAEAHLAVGEVLFAQGDLKGALAALDRALTLSPSKPAHSLRASVHARLRHPREAMADYEAAIRIDPSDATDHFQRAVIILSVGGEPEAALASLDRALTCSPDRVTAAQIHIHRAIALGSVDPEAARVAARSALELADEGSPVALKAREILGE